MKCVLTRCISGSKMSAIGGWIGAAAAAVGQKNIGQSETRPSKEHAQGIHSKVPAHQKSLAATDPLAAPSTEAAVIPQSILAETGDAQGPIRVQLWRDTVRSCQHCLAFWTWYRRDRTEDLDAPVTPTHTTAAGNTTPMRHICTS